jgi:hypothetical protein
LLLEQLAHELRGCPLVAPPLHQQIENLAFMLRVKRRDTQTACLMMSGGNWWRANDISMGHLTHGRDVGYRWRDETRKAPNAEPFKAARCDSSGSESRSDLTHLYFLKS